MTYFSFILFVGAFISVTIKATASDALATEGDSVSEYSTELNESAWILDESRFICSLSNSLPNLGNVYLQVGAGGDERIKVKPDPLHDQNRIVSLSVVSPAWKNREVDKLVANRSFVAGEYIDFQLNVSLLIRAMQAGRQLAFDIKGPELTDLRVRVPLTQFQIIAGKFYRCRDQLLSLNYKQAKNTLLYFNVDQVDLTDEQMSKLTDIADYVLADSSVIKITIDSHTDSWGDDLYNRRISEIRARNIFDVLLRLNVFEEKIVMRFHGERYPVATNHTRAGRDENRRVEIKLSK